MSEANGKVPAGGFNVLVPEFDVFDLQQSLHFWCGGLGFEVAYQRPEQGFAYLERDGAQVMLTVITGEWQTGPLEYPLGRGINFEIGVTRIDPLLEGLKQMNWPLFVPPREKWRVTGDQQSGDREFLVQDPNGYLLRFSESLGTRPVTGEREEPVRTAGPSGVLDGALEDTAGVDPRMAHSASVRSAGYRGSLSPQEEKKSFRTDFEG